ncbi:MAG: hypothetical protein A2Y10_11730 [Planctomycetes bacterium GWF2_41_51]|nr:MAG: hypothetical protein A2Y10_11730 [Planctomycetes bacterium GWF2_41_51]
MAGMFYTLQEVVEKLGKNEAEIKSLVKEGKLREFRDGAKQLYKIEDVDAIASSSQPGSVLNDSLEISIDESGEVSLAPEELDALMGTGDKNLDTKFSLDETGELMADEKLDDTPKTGTGSGSEILLSPAESGQNARLDTGTNMPSDGNASVGSISLESSQQGTELTNGDTKIAPGGDTINVLSDSDTGYKISEDTSGDTSLIDKKPKSLDQKGSADDFGIARLDEDINLEGAGSGSGLLDLSLQADDTSLGAVLDDIYPENPSAGLDQAPAVQEPSLEEEPQDGKMFEPQPEAEVEVPDEILEQPGIVVPVGAGVAVYETPADTSSNVFGAILFIPFIILIYSSIVVISGYKPVLNMTIVSAIGPIIWYVAAGLAAATIIGVLIASTAGAPKKPKAPKAPKAKKVKPVKEKKAKAKK